MPGPVHDELLEAAKRGDDASFNALIAREGPRLLRLTRRMMRTEEEARDCFQEAMLTVARRLGSVPIRFASRSRRGEMMNP